MSRRATTLQPIVARCNVQSEMTHLRELLRECFPAEAVGSDLSDPAEVMRLTRELLTRLWRWEN